MPANIAGCSVLTRPSIISGKPVTSEILTTGSPAAAIAFAVPPVEMSSTPQLDQSASELNEPVLVRNTQNCAHIGLIFLTRPERCRYYSPDAGGASVVSRGRVLAVFFYVRAPQLASACIAGIAAET